MEDMGNSVSITCAVNANWEKLGHARVAVSRQDGKHLSGAIFLVDLFCLGVKDVIGGPFRSAKEFGFFLNAAYFDGKPESISLVTARDIVFGGVAYAESLGFSPAPGFEENKYVLGAEPYTPTGAVTCGGPNNKPFYIVGPNDFADNIIQTLEKRVGKRGFEVLYPDA